MVQHFEGGDDSEGRVDHVVLHFGRRGVPFLWLITPTSRPEGLASLLEAKGMALIESLSGMAAPLRQVIEARTALEADVTISEATESDLEELYSFISSRRDVPDRDREAACAVYGNFRFGREGARARFWIARDGGRVVGKCLLHCGAGVAGIHGVATKPEARGRGIARALTVEALSSAVKDGYEVGVRIRRRWPSRSTKGSGSARSRISRSTGRPTGSTSESAERRKRICSEDFPICRRSGSREPRWRRGCWHGMRRDGRFRKASGGRSSSAASD
jgi:GNAT superfamily N-acetyltransferase